MIGQLRDWVLGLTAAALVCAVATLLTPKGAVKGVTKSVCGLVMGLALLSPLLRLDFSEYALALADYREQAADLTAQAGEVSNRLDRTVIAGELEAYILDKAAEQGAAVTAAKVSLRWSSEGLWWPEAATLDGAYHEGLAGVLEAELGIPRSAQTWRVADGAAD